MLKYYKLLVVAFVLCIATSCGDNVPQIEENAKNEIVLADIREIKTDSGDNISFDTYDAGVFHFELSGLKMQAVYAESGNIQGLYNKDYLPGIPSDDGKGGFKYTTPTKGSMKKFKSKLGDFLYFFGERDKSLYCVKEIHKTAKNRYGYNIVIVNSKSTIPVDTLNTVDKVINAVKSYKSDIISIGKFKIDATQKPTIDSKGIYKGKSWVIRKSGTLTNNSGFKIEDDGSFMLKYRNDVNIGDFVTW